MPTAFHADGTGSCRRRGPIVVRARGGGLTEDTAGERRPGSLLNYLRMLVRAGGLVVLDDHWLPSVAAAANYFVANTGWQHVPAGGGPRLRAFRLPDPPFEPAFGDFRPFL